MNISKETERKANSEYIHVPKEGLDLYKVMRRVSRMTIEKHVGR